MWCDLWCLEGPVDLMTPILCPQIDGIHFSRKLRNRTSTVFAERAFATWTWSGNRLRAKCCLRHGLLQSLWGRFLYSLYIVFGRDPASFIPTISIIVLPSTVALSKKREICLNLHALIWLSHGPLICCPRWWFQCLMFSVSYNTS